jgi:hypothetical protein
MNSATRTPTVAVPVLPPRRRPAWQWPLFGVAAVAALYLVGRGIAELFVIHWHDPSSYALDWGGPSLAGVLAVHSGPALVIIAAATWRLLRWWHAPRATQ